MWALGLCMWLKGALGESLLLYDLEICSGLIGVFVVKLGFSVWFREHPWEQRLFNQGKRRI